MKRLLRKIVVIVLCCAVSVMCIPSETEQVVALEDLISVDDIDMDFQNKQIESIEQYKNMLNSFNMQAKSRSNSEQIYDSNYGGAYIDDNGELVVLLVRQDAHSINEIQTYAGNDSLKTQECEYSFNELLSVINVVNDNLDYLYENGIIISEMYEDVYNNMVYIGVVELTADKEQMIRDIANSTCVNIYNQVEQNIDTSGVNIKGGDAITSNKDGNSSTIGFCATRNGVEGFVISGHAGNEEGEAFSSSGVLLGTVTDTAYFNNSHADAAFVEKSAYVNTSDLVNVYKCRYVETDLDSYPVGTVVYKYGISSKQTSGKVLHNFVTCYSNGKYFKNQSSTDFKVEAGDSGGPVYIIGSVVNGHITCHLLGIVKGCYGEYGTSTYEAFFSKYICMLYEIGINAITSQ